MTYDQLKLRNQLCFRLYTGSRLITQAYEPLLKKLSITYTQYLVLMVLWEEDNQPINDIGKKLMLGINTTSPLIKRMEKLGILSRRDADNDKRQQIVFLTQKGKEMREVAASIPGCMVGLLDECGIGVDTIEPLLTNLDVFIDGMSKRNK